jgi:diguanylate cyclase (GGDEF)-like protein
MDQQFQLRRDQSAHSTMQLQMSSSTRLKHIAATTENWLTQITPQRFFLIIFDNPGDSLPQRARLVHTNHHCQQPPPVDTDFDTVQILPDEYTSELNNGLLLMYPVFAGDMYFGYLLLDPQGIELAEMSSVASSIGNAMRNRYMIMQLQKQTVNLQDANMELEQLANFDALTGLPNRFNFHKRLEQTFTNSCNTGRDLCVMYVDLDGFKDINDTNGHKAGDQVLVNVARRLQKTVTSQFDIDGFVARLGGDEFTLILENFANETSVAVLADRIIEQIAQPIAVSQQRVTISASIGYVLLSHRSIESGATTIEALLHRADSAMYRAKQTGKNRTCVYDARLEEAESERRQLESKLQYAIRQAELTVHYQPRIDTETGAIRGAEALMRWLDSDGERVIAYPDEFIPLAESCGLIHDLDLLALNQCCRQVRAWLDVGIELSVSVNISVVHLQMDNFVNRVVDTIASHRIRCSQIELEITEGAVMTDVERCIEKLQALRFAGVRISIDDFGTGYSSLSYLKKLPITNLKIDRSFLMDITGVDIGNCADAAIVRTIVALGNTMDIGLIAEGIETQVQLDFIRELGVEEAQGYYFYRPVPATEMTSILLAQQTAQAA